MKKALCLLALATTSAFASPATTPAQAIAALNAAYEKAVKSLPQDRQEQFGNSQNAFSAWAQQDCKSRLGLPLVKDASLHNPQFATCMVDQFLRRADQLKAMTTTK